MDDQEYELEYDDMNHDFYFTNKIYENLYSQVDSEGHQFLVLEDIFNHQSYGTAISVDDEFITIQGEKKHPKKTTRGWELLTQMKKGF